MRVENDPPRHANAASTVRHVNARAIWHPRLLRLVEPFELLLEAMKRMLLFLLLSERQKLTTVEFQVVKMASEGSMNGSKV